MVDITRPPATRITGIVARKAPRVLILRRGPSKQVLAILWHTDTNQFHAGQWIKGRVYEHHCDLSPSGRRFIYRVETHRGPLKQWTAISRPPYFTALCLWTGGGPWGGGGIFDTENRVLLNHGTEDLRPAPDFRLPRKLDVRSYDEWANSQRPWPLYLELEERHGWSYQQRFKWKYDAGVRRWASRITQPEIRRKRRGNRILEARIVAFGEQGDPHYIREFRILDDREAVVRDLGRCDWADWAYDGRVLMARRGRLFDVPMPNKAGPGVLRELVDLRHLRFEAIPPPEEALHWTGDDPPGRLIE
jgi:hypothetical protein